MNPEELQQLSKEKLVEKLQELNLEEEQVMANMVMIREEILARLEEEGLDSELVGEYQLSKATRITFKTTLEEAEQFGAVIQAPKVDTKALRKLHDKKVKIPGVQIKSYLSVRRISQDEEETQRKGKK